MNGIPIESGAVSIADSRISAVTKCICGPYYEPSAGAIPYVIITQCQNGKANFYIRKADGTYPVDGTKMYLDAILGNK